MNYNQQTATSSQICVDPGTDYCLEWQTSETKTYNWFDTVVLFLLPITLWIVIGLFRKK